MNSFIQDSAIDLSLDLQQHYAHLLVFPQCYDSFIPAPHLPISALLDFTNLPPFDHSLTRPIKLAIKEFQHADIVNETLTQLSSGTVASDIHLDTTKGTLRDRSVRWFVEAYKAVNKTDLIKKAFALCKAGEDDKSNLSFESLTSIDTLRDLRDLPRTDPDMWQRIQLRSTTTRINDDSVDAEVSLPEDDVVESDGVDDKAPLEVVLEHIMSDKTYVPEGYIMGTDGSLIVDGAADKHCDMISPSDLEGKEAGRGKRRRIANTQYGEYDAH
ncbi:hypothetical protein F4604DRAFT_1925487 [Suillus subluteus]|nr:hypothetical protein F4604DRAFT_1925487 [Suillus subluteus]